MTTSWTITNTKRAVDTGLVTEVDYIIHYAKDGHQVRRVGTVTLTGDANNPSFISYENLNEQTVLAWVQVALGSATINELSTSASNEIDALVAEIASRNEADGLPW
jgi:hypothetical protein